MSTTIYIGARYRRPGAKKPVYRVVRMVEFKHHLPHVVLVSEAEGRRVITIGAAVLADHRQWVPAE